MSAPHPTILDYPFTAPPAPGTTLAVAPAIHWLRMPLPFALDHINLWLLEEEDGFTLIDCGYGDAPTRALWEAHFTTTMRGRPLVRIIATHYHPDHVGNAAWLSERFGCAVTMTMTEFLTAHAVSTSASHGLRDICGSFVRTECLPKTSKRSRARQPLPARRTGAAFIVAALLPGDSIAPAATPGGSSPATVIRRSMRRYSPRRATCSSPATCCCRRSAPT
jgi:glyoxylase-like metal-dependent hydrolase (beta-lactamase superfamily II)